MVSKHCQQRTSALVGSTSFYQLIQIFTPTFIFNHHTLSNDSGWVYWTEQLLFYIKGKRCKHNLFSLYLQFAKDQKQE